MNEINEIYKDSFDTFTIDDTEESNQLSMGRIDNPQRDRNKTMRITINTTGPQLKRFMNYFERKEFFYIRAIKNKIIHSNFLELALNLEEGNISEEQYEKEIDNNPGKYVIDFSYLENRDDIYVLHDIIKKIKENFSVEDASELFAIDAEDLHKKLTSR